MGLLLQQASSPQITVRIAAGGDRMAGLCTFGLWSSRADEQLRIFIPSHAVSDLG